MKMKLVQFSIVVGLLALMSACAVVPVQPIGYRTTSTTIVPSYVNDQYVPGAYVPNAATTVVQATRVYGYSPYYSPPVYVDPWYGAGVGLGLGITYSNDRHRGPRWHSGRGGRGRGGHRR